MMFKRKLLGLVCALLLSTGLWAQWGGKKVTGNGKVSTQTVQTAEYNAISSTGPMDVFLQPGTEGTITVKTDENLQEFVVVEVKNGTLKIGTKKNSYLRTRKGIKVYVPFNDLDAISLTGSGNLRTEAELRADLLEVQVTGSGDVTLDLDVKSLEVSVTGSGNMNLSGTAPNLEVRVKGSGDLNAFDLNANHTEVVVTGSGDAKVVAHTSLNARVNGSGNITYKGDPEIRDNKTSGSGNIRAK